MTPNHRFISFEGIDGAGKSTHIGALAQSLREQGHNVTLTREPGGTELSEKLRDLLLQDAMDSLTEALLMFAARREHIVRVILPALERGDFVLCDRFTDATFAYQGFGRGFSLDTLDTLEHCVQGQGSQQPLLQPGHTFWFDLPPEVAAARLSGVRTPDKFESQSVGFFQRVAQGYAHRCQQQPQRFVRLNAQDTPSGVWAQLLAACHSRGILT